jgi:hypothetical protein
MLLLYLPPLPPILTLLLALPRSSKAEERVRRLILLLLLLLGLHTRRHRLLRLKLRAVPSSCSSAASKVPSSSSAAEADPSSAEARHRHPCRLRPHRLHSHLRLALVAREERVGSPSSARPHRRLHLRQSIA